MVSAMSGWNRRSGYGGREGSSNAKSDLAVMAGPAATATMVSLSLSLSLCVSLSPSPSPSAG
jgi:hypothetical protein